MRKYYFIFFTISLTRLHPVSSKNIYCNRQIGDRVWDRSTGLFSGIQWCGGGLKTEQTGCGDG
jgi:hypothetical protein